MIKLHQSTSRRREGITHSGNAETRPTTNRHELKNLKAAIISEDKFIPKDIILPDRKIQT